MSDFNLIVSSLVLAILLPVSVAVLFYLMASHLQLAPDSAMNSAAVERFGSETERAEYHVALVAQRQLHRAAVMARYRQLMERELQRMDPRHAEPYRQALAASASLPQTTDDTPAAAPDRLPDAPDTNAAATDAATAAAPPCGTRHRRPGLWRVYQAMHRQ